MNSYDEILNGMKEKYKSLTNTNPDEASDLGIRFAVLAGELFSVQAELLWLKNQMFPNTAQGEYLDLHAAQRGLSRKNGKKAQGSVQFSVDKVLSFDVQIPEGTICATRGNDPVRFITTKDAVLLSGTFFVIVPVMAISDGANGNVAAKNISVMVTPIAGVDRVSNSEALSGGSDIETDEQLRARILDSFINLSNGTNKTFYINSAMAVDGVTAVGVVPRNRGSGTVDVFITNAEGNPSETLISEVQDKLNELREINVDIKVMKLTLIRTDVYFKFTCKKGYALDTVKSDCEKAVREYFKMLSAGETMYLSDLGEYINNVEGVKNYTFDSILMSNLSARDNCIIIPDKIVITGVQE